MMSRDVRPRADEIIRERVEIATKEGWAGYAEEARRDVRHLLAELDRAHEAITGLMIHAELHLRSIGQDWDTHPSLMFARSVLAGEERRRDQEDHQRCLACGKHKNYNWIRDVWCSLPVGHEGRHIAYWNHVITDEWKEHVQGEIGGPGGGTYFNWEEPK